MLLIVGFVPTGRSGQAVLRRARTPAGNFIILIHAETNLRKKYFQKDGTISIYATVM